MATWAVCVLALVLRAGMLWVERDELGRDPDAYLGIARNIAHGVGYAMPGSVEPTAYRPPLYPLALALEMQLRAGRLGIAMLHATLGMFTVLLTVQLGRRLGLGRGAYVAALLIAVDPLLVQYTARTMTETLFTFLTSLLLFGIVMASTAGEDAAKRSEKDPSAIDSRVYHFTWREKIALGVVFGLCALCRPTIWAFGLLGSLWWIGLQLRGGRLVSQTWRTALPVLAAAALTVAPWVVRNFAIFGKPIATTTHGGYTLLLGNNPVFYREVVSQPWGTVWRGASLERWKASLEAEMAAQTPPIEGEVARDRWMYERAWSNIGEQPGLFVRSCLLRLGRLWNVVPLRSGGGSLPNALRWAVGVFYGVVFAAMVLGIVRLRSSWRPWMPLILLLIAFSGVHFLYWSNARMRAPLMPAIALLAARGTAIRRPPPQDAV